MSRRRRLGVVAACLLTAFAAGRWSASESVKTQTNTQVEQKTDTQVNTDLARDKQKETTVTETTKPDGTQEKVTKTIETTVTKKKTEVEKTHVTTKDTQTSSEIVKGGEAKVSISALVGVAPSLSAPMPLVFGGVVTRQILGPIHLGGFGLSSGVFGLAIGLTF